MALALNLVREAIDCDGKKQYCDALIKYTEALEALGGALLGCYKRDGGIGISIDSSAKKFLVILNQCVGRINELLKLCENQTTTESTAASRVINKNSYGVVEPDSYSGHAKNLKDVGVNDLFSKLAINENAGTSECVSISEDPVAAAIDENRRLRGEHEQRLKRSNLTLSEQATLNMGLQRKMTENLEIARRFKHDLVMKKEKVRQAALDALDKNRETANLSPEEKQFIADVRTFEEECSELRLCSFELNAFDKSKITSPDFRTIFDHYVETILSQPDHPFCIRMRQMRAMRRDVIRMFILNSDHIDSIRAMIDEDIDSLVDYFLRSLLMKAWLKPKKAQVLDTLKEAYLSGLMVALIDYYRETYAKDIATLKEKLTKDASSRFAVTSPSPAVIKDAAKTIRSFNDALTPRIMLNILVSTCKAISCRDTEAGNERLNADDLICTLAAVVVEAKCPDIVIWAAIMEEFIDSYDDGQSAIGEEGFCLTSLYAAIQFVTSG